MCLYVSTIHDTRQIILTKIILRKKGTIKVQKWSKNYIILQNWKFVKRNKMLITKFLSWVCFVKLWYLFADTKISKNIT